MLNEAFEILASKVEKELNSQGFVRQSNSSNTNELTAIYTSENVAYSIVYDVDKKSFTLSNCQMTDKGPTNEWKKNSTWIFDAETQSKSDVNDIAGDFIDILTSSNAVKRAKQKKVKSDDEGNADPLFLAKRFVTVFPELKQEIKEETETYDTFRGVTFTRENILPKINNYLAGCNQYEVDKLVNILNTQYKNGDLDTRAIITMVILNSIEEKYFEKLQKEMSEDLKKSWEGAKYFKDKKVKPEKIKKDKAKARNYNAGRL